MPGRPVPLGREARPAAALGGTRVMASDEGELPSLPPDVILARTVRGVPSRRDAGPSWTGDGG